MIFSSCLFLIWSTKGCSCVTFILIFSSQSSKVDSLDESSVIFSSWFFLPGFPRAEAVFCLCSFSLGGLQKLIFWMKAL